MPSVWSNLFFKIAMVKKNYFTSETAAFQTTNGPIRLWLSKENKTDSKIRDPQPLQTWAISENRSRVNLQNNPKLKHDQKVYGFKWFKAALKSWGGSKIWKIWGKKLQLQHLPQPLEHDEWGSKPSIYNLQQWKMCVLFVDCD